MDKNIYQYETPAGQKRYKVSLHVKRGRPGTKQTRTHISKSGFKTIEDARIWKAEALDQKARIKGVTSRFNRLKEFAQWYLQIKVKKII